jgi:hypothetical protein
MLRFPWQRDVGALLLNNALVQHCCLLSDTTILDGLSSTVMQQCKQAVVGFVVYRLLLYWN